MNGAILCGLPSEKKCYVCGKTFSARDGYVYTTGSDNHHKKWFCSWHCMREQEKQQSKKPNKLKDKVLAMAREGIPARDIDDKLGVTREVVYYYNELYGGRDNV